VREERDLGLHTPKYKLFQPDNSALQGGGRGLSTISHIELLEVCAEEIAANTEKKRKTKTLLRTSIDPKNGRLSSIETIELREQPFALLRNSVTESTRKQKTGRKRHRFSKHSQSVTRSVRLMI